MKELLEGLSGGQTQGNSVGLPGGGVSALPEWPCLSVSSWNLVIPIQKIWIPFLPE